MRKGNNITSIHHGTDGNMSRKRRSMRRAGLRDNTMSKTKGSNTINAATVIITLTKINFIINFFSFQPPPPKIESKRNKFSVECIVLHSSRYITIIYKEAVFSHKWPYNTTIGVRHISKHA